MKGKVKKVLSMLTAVTLVMASSQCSYVFAAKKPVLNKEQVTVKVGAKVTLKIKNNIKGSTCKWKTSDKKVATVTQKGVVKGMQAGKSTITCKIKAEDKDYTLKCKVTVQEAGNGDSTVNEPEKIKNSTAIEQEVVEISAGKLIGFKEDSVYNFRGIPYATAERWKSPKLVETYENGERFALDYGPVAPQKRTLSASTGPNAYDFMTPGGSDMAGNEICQYLNVWSKDLNGSKPVVVFFHGGGLMDGSSNELSYYTGNYFVEREDVVFVSVNHRLNVLGYLDLSEYGDEYADSGNIGMEDCVASLQWVQSNIAKFGGDPKNVTIIGQSGGGTKVTTLACMSDTVGLFNRVVMMSGGYSTSNADAGKANTKKLIDYLGLSEEAVIPTLTSMPYEDLLSAATNAGLSYSTYYGYGTFEAPLFDKNGVINKYAAQREWIIGTTFSEFSNNAVPMTTHTSLLDPAAKYTIEDIKRDFYLPNIDDAHALELLTEKYGASAQNIADKFAEVYPDHKLAEALFINSMTAGGLSRYGLINEKNGILKMFNDNGVNVYNYLVNYTQPYFGGTVMHHTADIAYWFYALDEVKYMVKGDEEEAYSVAGEMADALGAFITDGKPSTDRIEWKPYTNDAHNTMIFDTTSECKKDFDTELYDLIISAGEAQNDIHLKN